jgi:hypothetical protein
MRDERAKKVGLYGSFGATNCQFAAAVDKSVYTFVQSATIITYVRLFGFLVLGKTILKEQ